MAATATHTDDHAHGHEVSVPDAKVDVSKIRLYSIIALVLGAAVYTIGGFVNVGADAKHGVRDFFLAYLCGFVFWCSLPIGSLLLSMIAYITTASWGIVFRRVFQASIRTLPLLVLLGVPVIVGLFVFDGEQSPYWWSKGIWHDGGNHAAASFDTEQKELVEKFTTQGHPEESIRIAVAEHIPPAGATESLHKIHDWLNPTAFSIRFFVYFGIILLVAFILQRQARKAEDHEDTDAAKDKLRTFSAPCIPLLVVTMTFFTTDWVMSVEPSWASSMFPVIYGMNMFLSTIAFSTLMFYTLVRVPNDKGTEANRPDLTAIIKDKFRIDIGSLTLGFCMVWAYGSFCQFMLVWAGNLPEEIPYYLKRGAGNEDSLLTGIGGGSTGAASGWIYLSYILIAFHWLIPFIILLFREVKTSPRGMRIMAILFLTVCACDVCWWIMPSVPHEKTWMHLPMAFAAILGIGGLWGFFFTRELAKRSILVTNSEGKFLANWGHH